MLVTVVLAVINRRPSSQLHLSRILAIQFLSFTNPISIPKCSTDDPAAFPGLNTSGLRQADFQRFENRYISNRSQEPPYFIDLGIGAIRRVFVDGPPEDGMERRDEERGSGERAL
jgi:hypothetical protein